MPGDIAYSPMHRETQHAKPAHPAACHPKVEEQRAYLKRWEEWRLGEVVPQSTLDVVPFMTSRLTAREVEIVGNDATALLEHMRERRFTAVEVTTAFCKVAVVAHELTNCLTEIFFEVALKRAEELDKHLEETGKVFGPLHGLPVSIKDHIFTKGLDTATGYTAWAYNSVATKDAVAVSILRQAGAVLYVKTANTQTLLSLETNNNIYGRTVNPHNRNLTSGGSSGGESALIASGGSVLGIGTDIGGSIRVPAGHAGLYGFKPSVARMPHAGLNGTHDGMEAIIGVLGPIATSARDMELFCRVMLQFEPWLVEPGLLEIPWKSEVVRGGGLSEKLTYAILWDDGVIAPHPPILDALQRTKDALISAGHEVIDWEPVDHQFAWDLILKLYFLDGGEEYRETMINDPWVPQTEWMLSLVPNGGKPFTIGETFKMNAQREAFRTKLAAHWNNTKQRTASGRMVDYILSPVAATLAPPHDTTRWWGYTSYFNLLDYPAAIFPVGRLRANEFKTPASYSPPEPRNEMETFIRSQWDPKTYDNAPVSLQLVGRRLNEEKVLYGLNQVESSIRSHQSKRRTETCL